MLITLVAERNSMQELVHVLCLIPSVMHVKHSNILLLIHNTKKSQVSATLKIRFRCRAPECPFCNLGIYTVYTAA